jgi:hypothetical protein
MAKSRRDSGVESEGKGMESGESPVTQTGDKERAVGSLRARRCRQEESEGMEPPLRPHILVG